MECNVKVSVVSEQEVFANPDIEQSLFDVNQKIDQASNHADHLDYFVAIASGVLCGMLDAVWVRDFNLAEGRDHVANQVNELVKKAARLLGSRSDDLQTSVSFLEKRFPIPEDGNTPDFGGGLQHHLRDFSHHPTIVGLIFSLLTQFTERSYGTDTNGKFISVPVPEKSLPFIGRDIPDKIFRGTVVWFFHLISDVAGSSNTVGNGGGTGIPGPILSVVKEISSLPMFQNIGEQQNEISVFLSKIFNGTIFAKRDENGKMIRETAVRFDFRGELGAAAELGREALPAIANDVLVRSFYFICRIASEIRRSGAHSFAEMQCLNWDTCKPFGNPTVDRMLLIATGVFTSVDLADAAVEGKYWVTVNYIGLGRFTVAVSREAVNFLRIRDLQQIRAMYERIRRNTFTQSDNRIYGRLEAGMEAEKFGLTLEQTEILYNLEAYKTENDIEKTIVPINRDHVVQLKWKWLNEWKSFMDSGFAGFVGDEHAVLHWYGKTELMEKIAKSNPSEIWFRLVLLEAMLFEPYYPLKLCKNKKGEEVPSTEYKELQNPIAGFHKSEGDQFLEACFLMQSYYHTGYIRRLRSCYDKVLWELNETLQMVVKSFAIAAGVTIAAVATAGAFAGPIAVALVGSNFAGLSGAALTSACLAYIGGGAIAVGGSGMLGGTIAIVGGGALLGGGVGIGIGGAIGTAGLADRETTILESAKLLVSVREIFLNDEHDIEYSDLIYEQYADCYRNAENNITELRIRENTASKEEKKELMRRKCAAERSAHAMEIAMRSMKKYISSFKIGSQAREN